MPVICMASPKGGTGKTTTSIILAGEIADAGGTVTIVDADPNFPFKFWESISNDQDGIKVRVCGENTNISDEIDAAINESNFVIVDLEGVADMKMSEAIFKSNLVMIPTKPSPLDTRESIKLAHLIRRLQGSSGRNIPHSIIFTQANPVIQTRTFKSCIDILNEAEIPMFDSRVIDRDAFRSFFSFGGTLHSMDPGEVPGLEKAKENAAAIIEEVIAFLSKKKLKSDKKAVAKANAA